MPDLQIYDLTQTGQEVQDILDSMGATYFFSRVCSTWASDSTYTDYPYKGTITLEGVDGTMGVEVTFSNADATSGNFSPICNTTNDAVEIWSKTNTSVTIPTIKITKNGYVNLNGDSNYMPQSGGNFTGAVTIEGASVVTESDIKNAIWGTYVYSGSSTTSISFTDNNVSGRTFIIGSCQDAGSPISAINLNGTTITVNLYQAVTVARINYMAFS